MKKMIFIISFLFVLSLFIIACTKQTTPVPDGKYDNLAKCLTANGAKMYGAYWCPHCQAQKAAFGSSFEFVTYVECASRTDDRYVAPECTAAGVTGYPTWIINGTSYPGEQNFYDLAKNSGCLDALN